VQQHPHFFEIYSSDFEELLLSPHHFFLKAKNQASLKILLSA
jgi:hypothetical protein